MIKRESYMRRIRPFIDRKIIKVLTGIRRSGKSVMLQLIIEELLERGISEEQFIRFNFEDLSNSHLCTAQALHDEIGSRIDKINGRAYIFLDEIQEVAEWEKCVNSLNVKYDCDIYITGSNAKLLSGELATYLTGRYIAFVITPFSFAEFIDSYRQCKPTADTREAFMQYIKLGGMPYLNALNYEEEPCKQYLQDVYASVELKDIIKRNNVRDVDLLERLLLYLSKNIGTPFSASAISKYFKSEHRSVSTDTVLNYLNYCRQAFLFYCVPREDVQGKKLLTVNEKYYTADHGIRQAVFGGNMRDINLVLENIVFMELYRRGYDVHVGKVGDKEIDFVCDRQDERLYVQVSYLLASPETIEREFGVYEQVRDNYPKYVVTMDEIDMSRNGIKHRNIRDFLLEEWG